MVAINRLLATFHDFFIVLLWKMHCNINTDADDNDCKTSTCNRLVFIYIIQTTYATNLL